MRFQSLLLPLCLLGSPVLAQTASSKPRAPAPAEGKKQWIPRVFVEFRQLRDAGRKDIIRLVQPMNDPAAWVTDADFPFISKTERIGGSVFLTVGVDANGGITSCKGNAYANRIKLGDAWVDDTRVDWLALTCRLVSERARFRPALAADRTTHQGRLSVTVQYTMADPDSKYSGPPVNPPPPPRLDAWPPEHPYQDVLPVAFAKLERGIPGKMRKEWNGEVGAHLVVNDAGVATACHVRESSGIATMDSATCKGLSASSFAVPRPAAYRKDQNNLHLLVRWTGGKPAIMRGTSRIVWAEANSGAVAAIAARANAAYPADARIAEASGKTEMELAYDNTGRVTQCYAVGSAGHDSLDIAACKAMIGEAGVVTPGSDVFGRKVAGRVGGIVLVWTLPTP
jgi:hypothetical protein